MFVLIFLSASCYYYLFITNCNYIALYMHSDPQELSFPIHHILSAVLLHCNESGYDCGIWYILYNEL